MVSNLLSEIGKLWEAGESRLSMWKIYLYFWLFYKDGQLIDAGKLDELLARCDEMQKLRHGEVAPVS